VASGTSPLNQQGVIVPHELVINARLVRAGPYRLTLALQKDGQKIANEHTFSIRWRGYPIDERPLDEAADQASYILNATQRRHLQEGGKLEKRQILERIWQSEVGAWRDYFGGQPEDNPARREYYARVDFVNQHFWSKNTPGWRTDRGKRFILNGPPDRIIRNDTHPNLDPHIIWIYDRLNKRYTFMDRSRQGEYKLASVDSER